MIPRFKNSFTVEPLGGICNRMRVIDAAISLASVTNKSLTILWYKTDDLNCPFDKIFEKPVEIGNLKQIRFNKLKYRYARFLYPLLYERYFNRKTTNQLMDAGYDFTDIHNYLSIRITTCQRFYKSEDKYKKFKPIQLLQEKIASYVEKYDVHTIGIHIRRTDHVISKKTSTLEKFILIIREEIKQNSATKIFLATDSPEDENIIKEMFGNRVITQNKRSLDRNTSEAIQDALVDLICLSKTKKIIGSCGSSFSETAAEIGNLQMTVAK